MRWARWMAWKVSAPSGVLSPLEVSNSYNVKIMLKQYQISWGIYIYMYVESCWIVSTSFQVMQFFTVSWNWIYIQYIHNGVRILSVSYGLLEDEMRCPPILSLWGATWCHRRSWSGNWYPGYPSFEKPMGSYGTNHWFNQPQKDVV